MVSVCDMLEPLDHLERIVTAGVEDDEDLGVDAGALGGRGHCSEAGW